MRTLINKLQNIKIQPVFVVDGELQEEKLDSFLKRAKDDDYGENDPDGGSIDLAMLVSLLFQICNSKKIECYRKVQESR